MEITNTYKNTITGAELFDGTEIDAITLVNGGSGYVENDILNLVGNVVTGKSAIVKVLTVDGSGAILTFNLEYHGYGYSGVGNVSSSGGSGIDATFDITNLKTANTIYSDRHLGNDATGNGTKSNPYATLTKLLSITVASTNVNRVFSGISTENVPSTAANTSTQVYVIFDGKSRINGNVTLTANSNYMFINADIVNITFNTGNPALKPGLHNCHIRGTAMSAMSEIQSILPYSGLYFKYNLITEARLKHQMHPYDTVATDISNNTYKMFKFNTQHSFHPRTIYNSIFQKVDLYPYNFTAQTYVFSFANCLFSTETEWYWNGTIIPITYNGSHNFQNLVDSLTDFANGLANSTHKTWLLTLLNGLFKTDANGQTNRVVNAITYPIFNLYNPENRIVVDYSLNIANNNVALNMGDVSAGAKYVGAFMPNVGGEYTTSNKVSWQTPINVNPDGTDDEIEGDILVLRDIIEQSEFKEIIISQFRTQTRNRLKTNVFRFGDLRKFCGVQCSMKSAIDLGFYYGKNQPYNSNQKPLESFEIVQYDNLTTPSTTKPTFSAPTGGECKMWYWVLGTAKENQPVLFNDLVDLGITTNKSLSEYGTWAITTADSESNQLKAMTTLVELKDIKLSYAQLVLNINYDSDLIN